jgi:hypothetical protein
MTGLTGAPMTMDSMLYAHISANTTSVLKSGMAGVLGNVSINTKGASSNTLTLYDNTTSSGTIIAVIDTTSVVGTLNFGCRFNKGLVAVMGTGTAADVTITFI